MNSNLLRLALSLLAISGKLALAQAVGSLGPTDGSGLPPTDLERVKVGNMAPDFTLESKDGQPVTLSSYRDKKSVILVFYRGHW